MRFRRGEEASNFAQLGASRADDGGGFVEAFARFAGSERQAGLLGAADLAEGMACAGECVAFAVDEALDFKSSFDVAAPVEALAGSTFAGLELGKLRLPEAEDVGFDAADASDVADFEIETVWNGWLLVHALGGELRGHSG